MSESVRSLLSPARASGFVQFVKYGVVGALSTGVQTVVFYVLAATVLKCLAPDDFAVGRLGLASSSVPDDVRAWRFAAATAIGFAVANVFCWLMSRAIVFRAGKFAWWKEFCLFIGVSGLAMLIATAAGSLLIRAAGMMTSAAVVLEIAISFLLNYFMRKFFIFRG